MQIFWLLTTHGDSRYLGASHEAGSKDHGELKQVAQAADQLGYEGVLIPTRSCADSPNLWAGVGLMRGVAGTALAGNPQEVAELLFPLLPLENLCAPGRSNLTGPFGEIIANDIVPTPTQASRAASPEEAAA